MWAYQYFMYFALPILPHVDPISFTNVHKLTEKQVGYFRNQLVFTRLFSKVMKL